MMAAASSVEQQFSEDQAEFSKKTFTYHEANAPNRGEALLSWIQNVIATIEESHSVEGGCDISLENVFTLKTAYSNWPEISKELAKLLEKPTVRSLIVPNALECLVVGKCGQALKANILQKLPASLMLYKHPIDLKSVIDVSHFTKKITCRKAAQKLEENIVLDFLKQIPERPANEPPPRQIMIHVVRAYKFIQKAKRKKWYETNIPPDRKDSDIEEEGEGEHHNSKEKAQPTTSSNSEHHHLQPKKETDIPEPLPCLHTKNKKCYVCKQKFSVKAKKRRADKAWKQYPRLCLPCAKINFAKRSARVDLTGKYAVVTGGRIKIGFETVLKLLRDGCSVIATTRFPRNAARDYAKQPDYEEWKDRLKIYPLDFKDIAGIYKFISYVKTSFPHLDILINNAAQTLRRPMDFYRELLDLESIPFNHIHPVQQSVLATTESLDYGCGTSYAADTAQLESEVQAIGGGHQQPESPHCMKIEEVHADDNDTNMSDSSSGSLLKRGHETPIIEEAPDGAPLAKLPKMHVHVECIGEDTNDDQEPPHNQPPKLNRSNSEPGAEISKQKSSTNGNASTSVFKPALQQQKSLGPLCAVSSPSVRPNTASPFSLSRFFPRGLYDDDGQQLDLRRTNSWRSVLQSVSLGEFMEVFVVNTVAPFILNKELKFHLRKSKTPRKFIVNVSAMEGQFNRKGKNKFHPHTNMAKAALNMMTRTAALEYKECNIYMTSVDTGWVSDERPFFLAKREEKKGFQLPLDCIDGAARVYDPIVTGMNCSEEPQYAVFIKDYNVYPW